MGEIVRFLKKWSLSQLNIVDKNILRIAIAEFNYTYEDKADRKVIINEAVELAKIYGGENSYRFINGILSAVTGEKKMAKFLGIDTSCYTTSAAVYDSTEGIVGESRIILSVKAGKRGLSQSEMVFQHVRNLPVILGQLEPWIDQINGIGVSVFPRRRADSYMPAFLVGKGMAESLSYVLRVPVFEFSHQENHALAAIQNMPEIWGTPFYMMHLSGGTQDVLSVEWEKNIMQIVDLIHSADITAGQFIDRVGVSLGNAFSCRPVYGTISNETSAII